MKGVCEYVLSNGERCTRTASKTLGNREFCWQHIKPARDLVKAEKAKAKRESKEEKKAEKESKKRKASNDEKTEKRQKQDSMEEGVIEVKKLTTTGKYCEGFIECSEKIEKDGYDLFVIPKGTILFHGTNYKFPDGVVPNAPAYFASFDHAMTYAFMSSNIIENHGANGKVITFVVKKDIKILNATMKSLNNLSSLSGFPAPKFRTAFGYGKEDLKRISYGDVDKVVTNWVCSKNLFDGWGQNLRGFHPEIVLCKTEKLERYSVEYRVDPKFSEYIFKMRDGILEEAFVFKPKPQSKTFIWYEGSSMLVKDYRVYLKPTQKTDKDYVAALKGLDFPEVE